VNAVLFMRPAWHVAAKMAAIDAQGCERFGHERSEPQVMEKEAGSCCGNED